MTFKEAQKQCRKVGTAHASGDALRAMYADMIAFKWHAIGNPHKFYEHLKDFDSDQAIYKRATELLKDHWEALDVVLA